MTSPARLSIVIAALFFASTSLLSARAQSEDLIINDPRVRFGVLENGLSYYVLANEKPADMAELRLVVKAGSVLEDEDQLGLAHFVEHMLFNGTERFPENELVDILESFGMEFGPEINAYTTFDQTVYRLSVKTDDEKQFLTGLDVLEEWAFNATLTEEQFEKERNVIHEEWRVGRGAQARMLDQTYPVLFHDSRYAERRPIGDMDVVMNVPVEALRRFYQDWYRPDLMAVIAVGDFDADETVALIRERFGSYENPENPRLRPEYRIPSHEETLVAKVHDPEAMRSSVQLYVKYEPAPARYRSEIKGDLAEQIFYVILNQRLGELSRSENPPFLYGYGFTNPYNRNTSLTGMAAAVPENGVLSGLESLLAEAERVQRYGFLDSELERAKTDVMSFFESYWKQRNELESRDIIPTFVDAFLVGDTYPSIDWQWDAVQDLLPGISLDDVNAVAAGLLGDSNRVVIINGPSVPAITDLREKDVLAALKGLESRPLEPWVDESVGGPLVSGPPMPGRIVERSEIPGTDIQSWTLSNGARVLIKDTDFRSDEILFRAISLGGASLVEDEAYVSSQFATDAVAQGGLGDYSLDNLRKALTGKNAEVSAFIQETYEGLSGSASPGDLETLMQLVYLHHTAARRDPTGWNALMNRMMENLKNRESSPMTIYEDLVWETLYDGHFRSRPITLERLGEADLDEALAIYSERFSGAGGFTYIFVGDLDTDELEPLVEQWIGGLPAGDADETWRDRRMRNLDGSKTVSMEAGAEPLSVVTQVWHGDWDGSFEERYRIQSLASALEMKLTKTIREESGGTYSVGVYPNISLTPHADYRFIIRYSCDPERVDELSARVKEIVDDWRKNPPEEKFAADIAASQRRSLAENLERNSWWLGQMVFAAATGTEPRDLLNRNSLYDTLNPELLSSTALRYLDDENYIEVVLYPDPGAENSSAADTSEVNR